MIRREDIDAMLDSIILSASGWRGIFAASGFSDKLECEESATDQISPVFNLFSNAAAMIFAEYLANRTNISDPLVLVGYDTRPTGRAVAGAMIPVLLALGCKVRFAGVTAAPEIMAWARSAASGAAGFIYISASHNPIGHNGLKFGLNDGGVLAADEMEKLIVNFRAFFKRDDCEKKFEAILSVVNTAQIQNVYACMENAKAEARKAYYDFCSDVVWGGICSGGTNSAGELSFALKEGLAKRPLGIVCDFNGSARTVSIDREFFSALGLKFECINGEPGRIAHRIVPEGESLQPCRELLEKAHERDASFVLGYVPDCDGDRGNLVIWDDMLKKAHTLEACASKAYALEAQEVFALACVAELSHLVWTGELSYDNSGNPLTKAAMAINDPTSMRIDRIAEVFGVSVFRAEVGEANVVSLARKLREQGYLVRILGEGSAGGNITHPSAVRDPLNTVLAIVKMLSVRSCAGKSDFEKPGLFEIWLKLSGQAEKYRDDFSFADIIASLPEFSTTPSYSKDAVLRINTKDHSLLKDRYQQIFLREWEKRKEQLKTRFGFCGWEAIAYNGTEEKRGLIRFGEAGRGGLKISFLNGEGRPSAYIWMRGSATEPVFRVMADVEATLNGDLQEAKQTEKYLLEWQCCMIMESDLVS
jgi:phosphoglucomutase